MKKRILSFLLLISVLFTSLFIVACGGDKKEMVDYAGKVVLDMNSTTKKQEVTVRNYIDGDTTHFVMPKGFNDTNTLKARYLAVNTPESTGKIEEWGKKASNYTKETLKAASEEGGSIIVESNDDKWNADSTGERYLVWVWYKKPDMDTYRCLNIELLQQGLAVGSKASETRYGEMCVDAINQASEFKLNVHSDEKDPDFYYGPAQPITLKELRLNIKEYTGARVSFEGIVTQEDAQSVYVESYDEEAGMSYGVYVYYGFTLDIFGKRVLQTGNRVRIVGDVQYWETGNSYQISNLKYDPYDQENEDYIKRLDKETHAYDYKVISPETFNSTLKVTVTQDGEEVLKDVPYAQIALNSSVAMNDLTVIDAYTTKQGDNEGAITLTCKSGNYEITVRTTQLYHEDGKTMVKEEELKGKTIDVKGILDSYEGEYQIKVFAFKDINIH